jgi:hypothetical protein
LRNYRLKGWQRIGRQSDAIGFGFALFSLLGQRMPIRGQFKENLTRIGAVRCSGKL